MASMLVVAGHSATGAWWSASAGDHPTGTLAGPDTRRWMLGPGTCAQQRRRRDCDMPTLVTMSTPPPAAAGVHSFHQPQAGCRGAVTRAGGWPRDLKLQIRCVDI